MGTLETQLAAGDRLHIWLKGVGEAEAEPSVALFCGEAPVATLRTMPSDDFLRAIYQADRDGTFRLVWEDAATVVSLAYAFDPGNVHESGVKLLWTSEQNRAPNRCYRLHFQAPWGWMNDPNGICEIEGFVHLFYQHYPHARPWNTSHCGYAASRDMVTWVHQPIFLLPREELTRDKHKQGGAFSGSGVPMPDGTLRVFYTDREDNRKPEWEWQMTAVSTDVIAAGPSEAVLTERPPIPGYRKDFRDPYVLRGPDGRFKMLIGGNDRQDALILLYETDDATAAHGWRFVDVVYREPLRSGHTAECPCLVPLDGEGEGLWALIYGLVGWREAETGRRNISFAITGTFDGRIFAPIARRELDFGTDCYAFQAFQTKDGPYGIGWAANWTDVFKEQDFVTAMTFARKLVWRSGTLLTPPCPALTRLRTHSTPRELRSSSDPLPLKDGLAELGITFVRSGVPFALNFAHSTIGITLAYDRGTLELLYRPPPSKRPEPRYRLEDVDLTRLHIFVDVGLVEIFVDDGKWCATKRIDSDEPISAVHLETEKALLACADLWDLAPLAAAAG